MVSKKSDTLSWKKIFILLLCINSLINFTSCNNESHATKKEHSVYEQVCKSGKIRAGYVVYSPYFMINNSGEHSGIFYDIFEEISKNLGFEVEYTKEVTWDGMIQDLIDNKIDIVIVGIWPTAQRGKMADFTDPIFYSPINLYTYYGNAKFDYQLPIINSPDVKISSIDGEISQIIANNDFPRSHQISVSQLGGVVSALMDIANKKTDIAIIEASGAIEFMQKNKNKIQEVKMNQPLRTFGNCMMIAKGQDKFKSMLNTSLTELQNTGFIDKIISKYEKSPHTYLRLQTPYRKDDK